VPPSGDVVASCTLFSWGLQESCRLLTSCVQVMIINVNPFGRYEHVKRVMDFSNTAMAIRIRQQAVRKLPPPQDWGAGRKRSPPRKKSLPREPAPEPDSAIVEDDTDPAAYLVFPGDGADWDGDEMDLLERVRHLRQAVRAP